MGEEIIRKNVSIYPEQETVVRDVARQFGLSFSSALRYIINDWARLRRRAEEEDVLRAERQEARQ